MITQIKAFLLRRSTQQPMHPRQHCTTQKRYFCRVVSLFFMTCSTTEKLRGEQYQFRIHPRLFLPSSSFIPPISFSLRICLSVFLSISNSIYLSLFPTLSLHPSPHECACDTIYRRVPVCTCTRMHMRVRGNEQGYKCN